MKRLLLTIPIALSLLASSTASSAIRPSPSIKVTSLSFKKNAALNGGARGSTMDVRMTLCASIGPKAVFLITQTRKVGSVVKARFTMPDPLGVDVAGIQPYQCYTNYRQSWWIDSGDKRFVLPGTYIVSLRVKDAYGTLSTPATMSVPI